MSNKAIKRSKSKTRQKSNETRGGISPLSVTLGIATLIGGAVAVLTLLSRISVTPGDPVDPTNTFSASFTIANNNFIPLRHVRAMLAIGQIRAHLDPGFVPDFKSRVFRSEWDNHNLDMDERFTISPDQFIHISHSPSPEGDIAIVVSYRAWILPWEQERLFRFKTYKQTNGNYYWHSVPLDSSN